MEERVWGWVVVVCGEKKVCEQIFSFLLGRTLDQNTPPELEELVDLTRPTNSVPSPSASISPVVLGSARTTPFFDPF